MQDRKEDRSLGDLFAELLQETSTLVRQEVALARTEMTQAASQAGKYIGFLAIGGAIAYGGFLAIMAAVILLVAAVLPWWLSALLVGLVVAGIGYFLIRKGLDALKQADLAPRQTIETLKEDAAWAKQQMR